MVITRVDPFTGEINEMDLDVNQTELMMWNNGTSAQDAFPRLNADEREFIKTGIYGDSWEDNIHE